ncbi:MAG TPA: hypothetical protein VMN04_03500 [Thermoanaerobaculia bacterium]|nr:hypothetical protein [Thermoanaerobaculia bacterium]
MIESLSTHLEDHLATWKSGLVDARRDIEALLAALSDKIPAQAKPLFPEDVVALMLEDAAPAAAPRPAAPPAPAPPAQADWTVVRGALAAVESARTQVDVLSRFLAQTQAHASRVALLVLRNDRLTGWKAVGYDATGGRDEAVRSVDLSGEEDPFVAAVLKGQRSMVAEPPDENSPLRRALGGPAPARSLLVPMVIRDRLAGLVAADELPGEEGRLNEAAIEVLTFVTGLAVDLLAARKKIPSPTLTPTGEKIARFEPAPAATTTRPPAPPDLDLLSMAPPAATAAAPAPPPAPAGATVALPPPRPRPTDARQALRAIEESGKRPMSSLQTFSDPGLTSAIPTIGTPSAPPPPPPAPPSAAGSLSFPSLAIPPTVAPPPPPPGISSPLSGASTGDFTGAFEALRASSAAARPSPGAEEVTVQKPAPRTGASAVLPPKDAGAPRPISGFVPRGRAGAADGPQRALDDARRLARLLISEIKLYNEKKVDEGRAAGDLYERLKDDIERSRQVYDERTPEHIRRENDFFRDELVRILADGRAAALGPMG